MSILGRLLWKSLSRQRRDYLLDRLSVVDRQAMNKALNQSEALLPAFERHDCIFIHVPKCAGTSVSKALFADEAAWHLPLTWYESAHPEFYRRAFKFAFVRDPLERAYSAYRYLSRDRGVKRDRPAMEMVQRYSDFDSFIKGWLCPENALRQIHFAPQWLFLCNHLGDVSVDFVGRQERIDEDFRAVCEQLGIRATLGRDNVSSGPKDGPAPSVQKYCSDQARRIILETYRRDYQLFGYQHD